MTYSFVVTDLNNQLNLSEFLKYIKANFSDYQVIYCSSKKVRNYKNVVNFIFEKNENPEGVINAVVNKCTMQNICIVRDVQQYDKITDLTDKLKFENQIVYFVKGQTKIKKFFWNIFKAIISPVFSHKLIPINFGISVYGKLASLVLKNIKSPSRITRLNKWEGINITQVQGGTKYRFKYNVLPHVLKTIIPLVLAAAMIVVKIFVKFNVMPAIYIGYYALILILLIMFILYGAKWIIASCYGDNIYKESQILN